MHIPDYTETPFVAGGRTPSGWDCYGCAWYVATHHLGKQWPSYSGSYRIDPLDGWELRALILGELDRYWTEVDRDQASMGDLLVLRIKGRPIHVGLYDGKGKVLHCDHEIGTVYERLDSPIAQHRVVSIHRHG